MCVFVNSVIWQHVVDYVSVSLVDSPFPRLQKEYSPVTLYQSEQNVKYRKGSRQGCRMQSKKKKKKKVRQNCRPEFLWYAFFRLSQMIVFNSNRAMENILSFLE